MFENATVTRPTTPSNVREVGYYWLGAGVVASVLVGIFLWSRTGVTVPAVITAGSVFSEFAFFGVAILAKERED